MDIMYYMVSVFERIIRQDFDKLKRDETGTIVYDKRLDQVAENLLHHEALQSEQFSTYDSFFNALMHDFLGGQQFFKLPEGCKSNYRYVNDILTKQLWSEWSPSNRIYIYLLELAGAKILL